MACIASRVGGRIGMRAWRRGFGVFIGHYCRGVEDEVKEEEAEAAEEEASKKAGSGKTGLPSRPSGRLKVAEIQAPVTHRKATYHPP
jgi:hypothetical protein